MSRDEWLFHAEAQSRGERRAAEVARAMRTGGARGMVNGTVEYRRTFLPAGESDGAVRSVGGGQPGGESRLLGATSKRRGVGAPVVALLRARGSPEAL